MNDKPQTWAVEDVSGKHRQLGGIAEYINIKCAENNLSIETLVLLLNLDDKNEIEAAVRHESLELWKKTSQSEMLLFDPPPERRGVYSVYGIRIAIDYALKPGVVHVSFCGFNDNWSLYEKAIGPLWFAIGDKEE